MMRCLLKSGPFIAKTKEAPAGAMSFGTWHVLKDTLYGSTVLNSVCGVMEYILYEMVIKKVVPLIENFHRHDIKSNSSNLLK